MLRSIDILKNPIPQNKSYEVLLISEGLRAGSAIWTNILIDGAYYFEKSELRDGVYAYIGLANEIARLASRSKLVSEYSKLSTNDKLIHDTIPFPVDYSKPISEVYQDVVKYLINLYDTLGPLLIFKSRKIGISISRAGS
jgi:hypothetical protein